MRRVSAKFVPRLLQQAQKELRPSMSLELRDRANPDSGFFKKSDHWTRLLGIWSRSWNENAEFSWENAELAISKESASIEIKCESHVDRFLQYWMNCSSWFCASRHRCELGILQSSCRTPTKRRNDEKGRKSGRTDLCCNMTTLHVTRIFSSASFWLIKNYRVSPSIILARLGTLWFQAIPQN
jgi:hypothetical protein